MNAIFSKFNERQNMLENTYEVYHYKDPYFKAPDFHSHDFYEFYFFIDGNVSYLIEGSIYELVPGDVLIISPGELHRPVISNSKAVYERIVLWISRETILNILGNDNRILSKIFENFNGKKHLLNYGAEEFIKICDMLNNIITLRQSSEPEDNILINPYISILLIKLYKTDKSGDTYAGYTENTVSEVIKYINNNIEKDLRLDILGDMFYISKYSLLRTFKNYTNTTIGQYIISKRITRSKLYIQQGDDLLTASQKSGFNNYSNFYKSFCRETGISPKKYASMWR